ncbi:hypothetical protein AAVH_24150 [Aphelenchoides avenae]|nr:hypothetical protein AAVH_24150 [Aphelenchus avenae]
MTPTPSLQPHNNTAATADNDTTDLPENADMRSDYAFTCPMCRQMFPGMKLCAENTPENAMKHLLRHLDDHSLYPYKCAHDGCDYTAITEGEVQQHVTGEHRAVWTEDVKHQCTHVENKTRLDALCDELKAQRSGLMLPSENVLDVLHCVDFASLFAAQRSGSAFFDVVHRNRSILPRLRVFEIYLDLAKSYHNLREIVEDTPYVVSISPFYVPYTAEFDYSTLQPLAGTVGTNFVDSAILVNSGGPIQATEFDMRKAVEALPALKHVRELECKGLMHTSYDIDMEAVERLILGPLDNLQCLSLDNVNNRVDWAFLRKEWALRLRSLSLSVESFRVHHEIDASGQAEILEFCTDVFHLEKGKSKKLTITGWVITPEFLQRIITCFELFEVSGQTNWDFLRKDWALRLRSLTVEALDEYEDDMYLYQEIDASGQAEILGYCADFVHLEKGKSKRLTITGWYLWPEFLQRIITVSS